MMSGMERYYQIVRCFRDEDLRADRQPEFTQLDIEMSFVDETVIKNLMESMIRLLFKEMLNESLPEITEISDLMTEVKFKVFANPANDPEGRVAALYVPNGKTLSRKQIDDYTGFVGNYGARLAISHSQIFTG